MEIFQRRGLGIFRIFLESFPPSLHVLKSFVDRKCLADFAAFVGKLPIGSAQSGKPRGYQTVHLFGNRPQFFIDFRQPTVETLRFSR